MHWKQKLWPQSVTNGSLIMLIHIGQAKSLSVKPSSSAAAKFIASADLPFKARHVVTSAMGGS